MGDVWGLRGVLFSKECVAECLRPFRKGVRSLGGRSSESLEEFDGESVVWSRLGLGLWGTKWDFQAVRLKGFPPLAFPALAGNPGTSGNVKKTSGDVKGTSGGHQGASS